MKSVPAKLLEENMIWRDHVFNYSPKSATRATKFREKKTGEELAETVFSRNLVGLFWGAKNVSKWPQNHTRWPKMT